MRIGFIHDEFGRSWTMTEAYPYTDPRAYYADFYNNGHGTIHHLPAATKGDKVPFRPDFDYSPYDIIVMFLQGGRCITDVEYIRAIKQKFPNVIFLFWWGELYRHDQDPILSFQHVFRNELEIIKTVDALSSSFLMYGEFLKPILEPINKPYKFLPEPYNTEDIFKNHIKTERNLENGIWTMVHGRKPDISRSLTVMAKLQKQYPELKCSIGLYHNMSEVNFESVRQKFAPNVWGELTPKIESHNEFLNKLAKWFFIFDDYPAWSGSNLSCCSACVGTPTITDVYNTSGSLCFPELTSFDPNDLDKWLADAINLIKNEDFYNRVMLYARAKAKQYYSYEAVLKRVEQIYAELSE